MLSLNAAAQALPDVVFIESKDNVARRFWLPTGGLIAFGGALRLFPSVSTPELPSVADWNSPLGWRGAFGDLAPPWESVGEDAFGTQYLLSPDAKEVALFLSESADVERIGVSPSEFLGMILSDPSSTISLSLFRDCVARNGPISARNHFAFNVELAVGGLAKPENTSPMSAFLHMSALGKLARQIHGMELGTALTPVSESDD